MMVGGLGASAAFGVPCLSLVREAFARDDERPNFLVVLTDDQTFRAVGYNNPSVKTPVLDELAARGIIFERAFIATPICAASRASLMTGMFPQQHGAVGLNSDAFLENIVANKRFETLPQALKRGGYTCALYGKSHLGNPADYGFDRSEECRDERAFENAHQFLESVSREETPFLLWLATHKPHIPLNPDEAWLNLYRETALEVDPNFLESPPNESFFNQGLPGERYYRDSGATNNYKNLSAGPPRSKEIMREFMKAYYATISALDSQIGEVIDRLKALGLYENTVIVFLSDNGYFLGNHGLGNKITMHEESVRVPMFVCWNRLPFQGVRCQELVSSLDVYPTVLALAGVESRQSLMGQSLAPLFENPEVSIRPYVASECVGVGGQLGEGHRMVRTKRWKYMLSGTNDEALYDELNDPYEMKNAIDEDGTEAILAVMRRSMTEWMEATGDTHQRPPSR